MSTDWDADRLRYAAEAARMYADQWDRAADHLRAGPSTSAPRVGDSAAALASGRAHMFLTWHEAQK